MSRRPSCLLNVEPLESRVTPAIGIGARTIIIEAPKPDANYVTLVSSTNPTGTWSFRVIIRDANRRVVEISRFIHQDEVNKVLFMGSSGNDIFLYGASMNAKWLKVEARGFGGNDTLHGGPLNDELYGGTGTDYLYGYQGLDRLYGGSGEDVLFGGSDNDIIMGGTGLDHIFGGGEHDTLYGCMDDEQAARQNEPIDDQDLDFLHGQKGADKFKKDPYGNDVCDFYPAQGDTWF